MRDIERHIDRILTLLRNKIRERGYTQLEVQETLGWGRSYISQILTKQKGLRVDQLLLILNAINVAPEDFYGELFGFEFAGQTRAPGRPQLSPPPAALPSRRELDELKSMVNGILEVLRAKGILTTQELSGAARREDRY